MNPDKKFVFVIMEELQKKEEYCPCRVNVDGTTLCPCYEFVNEGIYRCRLYIPIEKEDSKN